MRVLSVMLMMMGPAAAMTADEEKAYKRAAFQLTTAYQCAPIINDIAPYNLAKDKAVQLVGPNKAAEMIAAVESQSREGAPMTEAFCRNMLSGLKD